MRPMSSADQPIPAAVGVLKAVRDEQSPEGQKGIDALLKELDPDKLGAKTRPAAAPGDGAAAPNAPPAGFDLQLVPG